MPAKRFRALLPMRACWSPSAAKAAAGSISTSATPASFRSSRSTGAACTWSGIGAPAAIARAGFGEEDVLAQTITALEGVTAVLCAKIGRCPEEELERAGIKGVDDYAFEYIETAVAQFFRTEVGAPANQAQSA